MDPARFERILVEPVATIREVIQCIDAGAIEIALIVDSDRRLLGTVTDGDVRRALLAGATLEDPVQPIVHRDPVIAPSDTDPATLLGLMTMFSVDQVPLIADERVVDIVCMQHLVSEDNAHLEDHPIVLMAGGKGTRLYPLTASTPKPMLPIGGRPLLEQMVDRIRHAGFSRILMAVNYQADVIEEHFGDGSQFGVEIGYLREDEPLGSAGALGLAGAQLDRPFLVMNADILTNVNLPALMRFHLEEHNAVTVGVRRYALKLPYGVLGLDDTRIVSLTEKPTHSFFVNAGIYAVNPSVVELVSRRRTRRFDMTDLISAALSVELRVGGFPIREYWLDIGQLEDYKRAETAYATVFSSA